MARMKMQMEPGKRYKGTAFINEYGEFDFTPYQQGTRENGMKVVRDADDYSIYESAEWLKISVKVKKQTGQSVLQVAQSMMQTFTSAVFSLKKYINESKQTKKK